MSTAIEPQQLKQTSLYVGDLHPLVSDALLFTKFSEVGAVINARVCRDAASRESLGYGYVNYRDHKDAEHALELMNYGVFFGRPFRLMWSQRDPTLRKSGKGNIFVKNLDKSILPTELYDTFEQFGNILSCKLATDEKGVSKGFGFVHYESEDSANRAISYVNGREIRGRVLYVGPFIPKTERKSTGTAAKFNNCFVKNFGEDMDDERFKKMFEKFGEIKSACVMMNDQKQCKGFGFVCFEEPHSAEAAVKEMDGMDINGKPLFVGRAQRKEERQVELKAKFEKQRTERQSRYATGVNLYVKNLDDNIDDEKLREAFSKFGDITSAKVMCDTKGVSRSFGFVCFRQPDHAALAVTNMNSVVLGNKPLYVAIAQRKEDRRAKLAAEYQARVDQLKAQIYPIPQLPTAGYQLNQNYFQRQFMGTGPRWQQQPMVANTAALQLGAQAYQAGANPRGGPANQQYNSLLQVRGNPAAGGIQLAGRQGAGGAMGGGAQMNQMFSVRPNQPRQLAGGMGATNQALQQRVNMTGMNPSMMQQRGGPQVQGAQNVVQRNDPSTMGGANPAARFNQPPQQQPQQRPNVMPQQPQAPKDAQSDAQIQALGTRLYDIIAGIYPEYVGKLTGVMLSMGVNEVSALFDDQKKLEAKIHEAYQMWNAKKNAEDNKAKEMAK